MRSLNVIMLIVGIVVVICLGLLSLISAIYPGVLLNLGDFIAGPLVYVVEGMTGRVVAFAIGLLLLASLIYLLLGNLQAARRERTVVLQNPMGEVMVSLPAIEDFARVLKGRIEGLRDIKGRVTYTRKGLKVVARITIFSDFSIADVTEKVQEEIRAYIQKTLSIEQEINPTVIVHKVVSRERNLEPQGIKTSAQPGKGTTELPTNK
ncbi:alkaline shock response membrane anchor protein AmaP [bacterium]|nr:alkaline shock response membrane anchor protein AmaP [bacterium]